MGGAGAAAVQEAEALLLLALADRNAARPKPSLGSNSRCQHQSMLSQLRVHRPHSSSSSRFQAVPWRLTLQR